MNHSIECLSNTHQKVKYWHMYKQALSYNDVCWCENMAFFIRFLPFYVIVLGVTPL